MGKGTQLSAEYVENNAVVMQGVTTASHNHIHLPDKKSLSNVVASRGSLDDFTEIAPLGVGAYSAV